MDAISLLGSQVTQSHRYLQATVQDMTPEQAHWNPGGNAVPAGAMLAHVVMGEDFFLNMTIGRPPLGSGQFAGKTGLSEMPPMGFAWGEWAGRVEIDLPALSEYAAAVFKSTEEYVAGLKPEDLDREMDLTNTGLGKTNLGALLTIIAIVHPSNHSGEISCLKGQQGAKGYPM
jgi:hypothetical protein